MDLDPIDLTSPVPPFDQVRAQIAGRVAAGRLPAGARLPTVRQLAAELGLATNTVAKAYRRLETDDVIDTQGRRGTFVSSSALSAPPIEVARLAADLAHGARRQGLTLAEAQRLVEAAWG